MIPTRRLPEHGDNQGVACGIKIVCLIGHQAQEQHTWKHSKRKVLTPIIRAALREIDAKHIKVRLIRKFWGTELDFHQAVQIIRISNAPAV